MNTQIAIHGCRRRERSSRLYLLGRVLLLLVLVVGGGVTLVVLFRADRAGHFRGLAAGATVLFDDDEPLGVPQDQLYAPDSASASPASDAPPHE